MPPIRPRLAHAARAGKGSGMFVLIGGVIALAGGLFLGSALQRCDPDPKPTSPTEEATVPTTTPKASQNTSTGTNPVAETVESEVQEPSAPVEQRINLDVEDPANQQIRREVLKRIDLMPDITPENKDKLYIQVDRARQMGCIATVPFASGQRTMQASAADPLRKEMARPEIAALLRDPTVVFVLLGYADTKGDEKVNHRISMDRAESIQKILRDNLGILNLTHAVAMGGSELFDQENLEKNRVVEIWAVVP